jgi:hypothetical protein
MSQTFRAPWGTELTVLTLLSSATILGAAAVAWSRGGSVVAALLLVILAIPLALTIRGYALAPGELRIRRLWWDTRWPLDGPIKASVRPQVMARSWRLWGNGGMFAISGHFSNAALGRYRAFVTDFKRTVVVETPRGIVVVSPDRPDQFVAAVEDAARRR